MNTEEQNEYRAHVRELYLELGGGRQAGGYSGSTVIIPNRSFWASMWRISPDEVQVMTGEGPVRLAERAPGERVDTSESVSPR